MSSEEAIYYYTLYVDIVGSSDSQLGLEEQINKVNIFNHMIKSILSSQKPNYSYSTVDGIVISFSKPLDSFVVLSRLQRPIVLQPENINDTGYIDYH